MMQDVKDGIIDCIVVKDLSRFAREYIDAGRYIERMFPAMGIRFIAINDAYDSADTQAQGNEIIIPFKNLINDAYDIYMDDEISGTTFDRPEFERMMSDMRAGRINCIVVKDLSRLGRDYIETGNLVERVFPMMNIRFVAITDNYDS